MSKPVRPPRRRVDGILLLDKRLGVSSNQALQEVRRLFRADKAGHTGSLDPLATGLLPVCFGEATKLSGLLLDSDKRYTATVSLGARTSTGDAEGEVIERSDPSTLNPSSLDAACERFTGPILQVPPMYSALKHEGQRLYELARAGTEVERAARPVVIHQLQVLSCTPTEWVLDVRCSKGTYIRTLAEDLAAAVGQCAHLSGLRRTSVDPFGDLPMLDLEALNQRAAVGEGELDACLLPLASAVRGWPTVTLDAELIRRVGRGQAVPLPAGAGLPADADVAVFDRPGTLLAIARLDAGGRLAPRRWLGGSDSA